MVARQSCGTGRSHGFARVHRKPESRYASPKQTRSSATHTAGLLTTTISSDIKGVGRLQTRRGYPHRRSHEGGCPPVLHCSQRGGRARLGLLD